MSASPKLVSPVALVAVVLVAGKVFFHLFMMSGRVNKATTALSRFVKPIRLETRRVPNQPQVCLVPALTPTVVRLISGFDGMFFSNWAAVWHSS